MSAWSHLTNAAHIDEVLESVQAHPDIWLAATTAPRTAARNAAMAAAWNAAWNAARNAPRDAAWDATWDTTDPAAAMNAIRRDADKDAILALVAYDDCEHFLEMSSDQLRIWIALSEHPAAILLLPAVIAFEQIKKLNRTPGEYCCA
jgi:hypothetical protein